MKIVIIGLGLMGGSIALGLRRSSFGSKFIGIDQSSINAQDALDLKIVDSITTIDKIPEVDIIILATPIDTIKSMLPKILDQITNKTYVIDLGSTKRRCCKAVINHPKRKQYIATHPMAGTENSGPKAAFAELFLNKVAVICDQELSDPKGVELIKKLYASLWMRTIEMSSEEHDRHIAYVSHLSHVTSFALGNTVLNIEKNEKNIFDMASTGFASTVRLAKSSPEMWAPIFEHNKDNLLFALDAYIKNLEYIKNMLSQNQFDKIKNYMSETNDIRRILNGINNIK